MGDLITLRCPSCNADLQVEEGRESYFCPYCGAIVIFDNGRDTKYTIRDEAKIHETDVDKEIRLEELRLQELSERRKAKAQHSRRLVAIIAAIIGTILMFIGYSAPSDGLGEIMAGMICLFIAMFAFPYSNDEDKDDPND